ncbi:MAG TPA: hypothetical protein VH275_02650 [Solirubrobacterales bacterium]|nr:hypothetical protein [Solirubrobacterales bacterium]
MASHDAPAVRVAWWASFFATLTLIAILGLARSAQALTIPANDGIAPAAERIPPPDEEAEDEAEASEEGEFEDEECEEGEECGEEEGRSEAPEECLLTAATATVSTTHDGVRLLVRYTTSSSIPVSVEYGLHGAKGSLYLGTDHKRFGATGTLRLSKQLTDPQMAKVVAAKNFTVRLHVPDAPGYCGALFERQLDVRRATPGGLSWSQSE